MNPATDTKKLITEGKEAVRKKIGMYPNVVEVPANVFSVLDQNNHIRERLKYTSAESVTAEMLARYWEVDKVIVAKSVSTETEDGDLTDVWTEVVLAYVPTTNRNQGTPSFGYTYYLEGHPLVEENYYDKGTKSFIYPVEFEHAPYLTAMDAGFIFLNPAAQ